MIKYRDIENKTIIELENKYPFVISFFENNKLEFESNKEKTLDEIFKSFTEEDLEEWTIEPESFKEGLVSYINQMTEFLGIKEDDKVNSLTILPGTDKNGNPEGFKELKINKSEIISIVGPTGSGKSRLLADIEWTANKDTPTNRSILINGEKPDMKWRFSSSNKLVAQLSQNMNFVMDLTVEEFIELHAKSRLVENVEKIINKIIEGANHLAGERFSLDTPITSLSGGQSRALMIADTAILSTSPIVLIDEIENAGIDKKRALNLLISEEKIVVMATHDPSLALMGDKRIVIKNGGISKVIETSDEERKILIKLEKINKITENFRNNLRNGNILKDIVEF